MNIKDILNNLFGSSGTVYTDRSVVLNVVGSKNTERDYINAIKTNRKKARDIYHNVDKNYALSGQLVRPIINNNVNFIGIPELFGNKKSVKVINDLNIDYRKVHKSIEIDGDIFIWPQWDQKEEKIKLVKIPIDIIQDIYIDPVTKKVVGYKLSEYIQYNTPTEDNQKLWITVIATANEIVTQYNGAIEKTVRVKNYLGVVPIVHFSNDRDLSELYGHSEIESIEPQLKFYHDLTFEAGAAQSRDGHPKLKVKTSNPRQWINNNFGAGTYDDVLAGKTSISMADRDLFVNNEDEDVNYLYLNKTTGDYQPLAENTFTNVVEGSETPEINFGANIGTSLASVKEYRPVWIKKIEAKQYERTQPWLDVYAIILKIHNFVNLKNLKNDITITWPTPKFASSKEQSEILKAFSDAVDKLKAKGLITNEEVYDTLVKLGIFEMAKTFEEHQKVADEEVKNAQEVSKEDNSGTKEPIDEGSKEDDEGDT